MTVTQRPQHPEQTPTILRLVHRTAGQSVYAIAAMTALGAVPELRGIVALAIGTVGTITTAAIGVALASVQRRHTLRREPRTPPG
ncbi:hypothetical protein Daura_14470 [Dactylosporangium aurantiacum]|uniref:Uncharacterized protein n=1 Tax=Dactylosporangium aurantiacum TaxID=35754 RepID=A0A9Q9MFJ7_9ACTN|nr:hypothetical protein [Dactylosporangium aurantiacum]MDG6108598.1 hypothetical protein [Dactylosporangium aurantiacum]UWZ57263.1 hypothetical protein Daura_14470 [Dactylosporangium aurantiacum]